MFRGPHLARPAHAALHFVKDEQHTKTFGNARKLVKEFLRRDDVTTFALHRLYYYGRYFIGRHNGFH